MCVIRTHAETAQPLQPPPVQLHAFFLSAGGAMEGELIASGRNANALFQKKRKKSH